jgi:hypothetical protein
MYLNLYVISWSATASYMPAPVCGTCSWGSGHPLSADQHADPCVVVLPPAPGATAARLNAATNTPPAMNQSSTKQALTHDCKFDGGGVHPM